MSRLICLHWAHIIFLVLLCCGSVYDNWAASSEFGTYRLCEQRRFNASLRICAVSPEPPLLAHTSIESRGTFRQKARSLAPLNGWACTVKICHDGMLEDTNSLDGAHMSKLTKLERWMYVLVYCCCTCCLHGQISSICIHLCFCQCPPKHQPKYITLKRHFHNKPAPNVTKKAKIQSCFYCMFLLFYERAVHAESFPGIAFSIRL